MSSTSVLNLQKSEKLFCVKKNFHLYLLDVQANGSSQWPVLKGFIRVQQGSFTPRRVRLNIRTMHAAKM